MGKTRHIKTGLLKKDRVGETLSPIRSGVPSIPGTRFSKDLKLFGRITGDIILSIPLKRRRLEVQNFVVILLFNSLYNK